MRSDNHNVSYYLIIDYRISIFITPRTLYLYFSRILLIEKSWNGFVYSGQNDMVCTTNAVGIFRLSCMHRPLDIKLRRRGKIYNVLKAIHVP